jgi:protein-S-isoprenylcysteine O-methyltransferase Ste14
VASRATRLAWLLAAALLGWSCGYARVLGGDLWWHLAAGEEFLAAPTLGFVDRWSFTAQGHAWRHHEWLTDALLALLLLPLVILSVHHGVILREEAYLERKFGEAYLTYKSRVRRWL